MLIVSNMDITERKITSHVYSAQYTRTFTVTYAEVSAGPSLAVSPGHWLPHLASHDFWQCKH